MRSSTVHLIQLTSFSFSYHLSPERVGRSWKGQDVSKSMTKIGNIAKQRAVSLMEEKLCLYQS